MANIDFIEIYDNSVSQEVCDKLIKWFNICSEKNFTVHNMPFSDEKAPRKVRSDESLIFPCGFVSISDLSIPNEICNNYWNALSNCYNEYTTKYDLTDANLSCHTFKLHKVKKGQGYHVWHYENGGDRRTLAWMTYLRVPEEGGETEFLWQSKRIEPIAGRTLIWPAYFTHLHRGNPPLKGEKYYITGWFERA